MSHYLVQPGEDVDLDRFDPSEHGEYPDEGKHITEALRSEHSAKLESLQELLYCERKHKFLVVLQGMDTAGKDGVIRHVFEGVNPQGVRVASFKVPTPIELDHDYLWRIHQPMPGRGEMVIFNRSHYEDVLVVRVHSLVPEQTWQKRYDQINQFEKTLAEEGTTILKFFLHISKDEQRKRLLARLEDPAKRWKFNPGDLEERQLWKDYVKAYTDVLSKTSTHWAPWYIIPANHKWYRDILIGEILVDKLESLDMHFPEPVENLDRYRLELQSDND